MKEGKVLIICAPSGTGKSTIISSLRERGLQFHFSVSATSRAPREGERDGVDYFFLTLDEMRHRIERDEFIEYEEVYAGTIYGTLKQQVETQLASGKNIVFDVDVNGGLRIKQYFGERALSLFIQPPSIAALRSRLEKRGTETEEKITMRLARAEYELSRADAFDRIVINDTLEKAEAETYDIVSAFLNATSQPRDNETPQPCE